MSALNRQSHATNDEPLWLSVNGGDIDGDITARYITATSGLELTDNSDPRNTIFTVAAATNGVTGNPIIQTAPGATLRFGQFGQAGANTTLTCSAPGANLDTLAVGGNIVVSGVPSQGLRLNNAKYISFLDDSTPNIESMRVLSGTTGTPGLTFSQMAVQPGSSLYFSQINQSANSSIRPSPYSLATPTDELIIGGAIRLVGQSSGTGTIPIGATNVVIPSNLVTATSKIFLSFFGSPSAGPGNGPSQGNLIVNQSLIVPGTSFRVDLTTSSGVSVAAAGVNVTFNWMIIN